MTTREMPDAARLLRGVEYRVYQAMSTRYGKPGAWLAHVSGLQRGDLDDCLLRSASLNAEGIAGMMERKIALLVADYGFVEPEAREKVLQSYASRYRITFQGEPDSRGYWTEVGHCSSADEARERACAVIGHVFGRRLSRATAGYVPTPEPVPAIGEAAFR